MFLTIIADIFTVRSPASWVVFAAIAVMAVVWHFATGSIKENTGRAARAILAVGWALLILFAVVALASAVDCSVQF